MKEERIRELAQIASTRQCIRFTDFLEIPEQKIAVAAAGHEGISVILNGGFPKAERCVACFYPPWCYTEDDIEWCFTRIRAQWNEHYAVPGHRDLLGAILGLGINREKTGDICIGENFAQIFAHNDVASFILNNLHEAGHTTLKLSIEDENEPVPEVKGTVTRVTLQSMRLDAVVAACTNMSRADAQELIRRGLVKHNHAVQTHLDYQTKAGDILSLRGYGRYRIEEEAGSTKRGRLALQIFRFGE